MFGLNMYSAAANRFYGYAEALAFYERCPTRRGDTDRKIIGKENSKVMGVSLDYHRRVRFRYHSTDVVVWASDGRCELDLRYVSVSTAEFANCFTPHGVSVLRRGLVVAVQDVCYPAGTLMSISRAGEVTYYGSLAPKFRRHMVDRTKARALLKQTRYAEYCKWYATISPIMSSPRDKYLSDHETLECLADETRWFDLYQSCSGTPPALRSRMYRYHDAYKDETADTLPSVKQLEAWDVIYG